MKVERENIGNVVEVIPSNVDKVVRNNETLILLCNYMDVYNNRYLTGKINYSLGSVSPQEFVKFSLRSNDVIITKDSETPDDIAVPSVIIEEVGNLICGYHLALLRPKADRIDGQFLMHLLQVDEVKKQFSTKANGSTRYGLTIDSIKSIKINFPPLPAQQKIAKILQTVDGQIDKTEAIIAKYKAIKQGLMQDLFTRGIDVATGKLRPRYQDAPERYKPSPLGMIPMEWVVEKFSQIGKTYQLGTNFLGSEGNNGIPLLKMGNLTLGGFEFSKLEFIQERYDYMVDKYKVNKGDFLFNTRNTLELVGKIAVWNNQLPIAIFNSNIMRVKFYEDIDDFYLGYYFQHKTGWSELKRIATGTTSVAAIYTKDLLKALVLKPELPEQLKIKAKLMSVEDSIRKEELPLHKLQQLKKGLMSDLLSGKVRVQVNEEAVC